MGKRTLRVGDGGGEERYTVWYAPKKNDFYGAILNKMSGTYSLQFSAIFCHNDSTCSSCWRAPRVARPFTGRKKKEKKDHYTLGFDKFLKEA